MLHIDQLQQSSAIRQQDAVGALIVHPFPCGGAVAHGCEHHAWVVELDLEKAAAVERMGFESLFWPTGFLGAALAQHRIGGGSAILELQRCNEIKACIAGRPRLLALGFVDAQYPQVRAEYAECGA